MLSREPLLCRGADTADGLYVTDDRLLSELLLELVIVLKRA